MKTIFESIGIGILTVIILLFMFISLQPAHDYQTEVGEWKTRIIAVMRQRDSINSLYQNCKFDSTRKAWRDDTINSLKWMSITSEQPDGTTDTVVITQAKIDSIAKIMSQFIHDSYLELPESTDTNKK